jgi:hypothetical protein
MSIKAWGVIGGTVSLVAFRFLRYRFGGGWAIGFLAFLIVAWIALCLVEKRQLERLQVQISKLGPEQREQFIRELDPKIQADLRKIEKSKSRR